MIHYLIVYYSDDDCKDKKGKYTGEHNIFIYNKDGGEKYSHSAWKAGTKVTDCVENSGYTLQHSYVGIAGMPDYARDIFAHGMQFLGAAPQGEYKISGINENNWFMLEDENVSLNEKLSAYGRELGLKKEDIQNYLIRNLIRFHGPGTSHGCVMPDKKAPDYTGVNQGYDYMKNLGISALKNAQVIITSRAVESNSISDDVLTEANFFVATHNWKKGMKEGDYSAALDSDFIHFLRNITELGIRAKLNISDATLIDNMCIEALEHSPTIEQLNTNIDPIKQAVIFSIKGQKLPPALDSEIDNRLNDLFENGGVPEDLAGVDRLLSLFKLYKRGSIEEIMSEYTADEVELLADSGQQWKYMAHLLEMRHKAEMNLADADKGSAVAEYEYWKDNISSMFQIQHKLGGLKKQIGRQLDKLPKSYISKNKINPASLIKRYESMGQKNSRYLKAAYILKNELREYGRFISDPELLPYEILGVQEMTPEEYIKYYELKGRTDRNYKRAAGILKGEIQQYGRIQSNPARLLVDIKQSHKEKDSAQESQTHTVSIASHIQQNKAQSNLSPAQLAFMQHEKERDVLRTHLKKIAWEDKNRSFLA